MVLWYRSHRSDLDQEERRLLHQQFVSTELYQWVSTVFERRSFRTLACEQGLIHTAVWAAKPARGLSRVLIPDSWHTFHEFRRCYCIVSESWLLFEWWAPYCMKKSSSSFSIQQFIMRVSFCTTVMIRFSATGASLLLLVEGRALIWNRPLSSQGQGAYLFFENQQNVKQSFNWKTHLWSVGPSLLERLAEQLLQNFKTGSFVLRNWALTAT